MDNELLDASSVFTSLDLDHRLQKALSDLNYQHPTLIQSTAIPLALEGKDILARARTGSGKTAAYCLPLLQKILSLEDQQVISALILVPTRELAEQVTLELIKFCKYCSHIRMLNLSNGDQSMSNQRPLLAEKPQVLISTPSKVLAHLNAQVTLI
jgi:ATP-dependent RNA helicase DDX56/DBP9